MWMMVLLLFTVLTCLALIVVLPVMFGIALLKLRRQRNFVPLLRFLSIAGGLVIGMSAAWFYVVVHDGWNLSFGETFYAMGHSDIYGGMIEDASEDYIFFTLLVGDIGAILVGIAGWLTTRRRLRMLLTT